MKIWPATRRARAEIFGHRGGRVRLVPILLSVLIGASVMCATAEPNLWLSQADLASPQRRAYHGIIFKSRRNPKWCKGPVPPRAMAYRTRSKCHGCANRRKKQVV